MKTILIDDEINSLKYLSRLCMNIQMIEIEGMFENSMEAIHFIDNNAVDLVILDIEMPGLSGLDAVHKIKKIHPNIGIIFVTGHEMYAFDAYKLEAIAYIMKPAQPEELERAIQRARKLLELNLEKRVKITTFGYFSVSIDKNPIYFSNAKSKELLALLVNHEGNILSMEQITSVLWEDRCYDDSVKQLYRKSVMHLNMICKEYNTSFFNTKRANCSLTINEIDCDYFNFLNKDISAIKNYNGEYMLDYSWSEYKIPKLNKIKKESI